MTVEDGILAALKSHPEGLARAALQKAARRARDPAWKFLRVLKALEGRGLIRAQGTTRSRRYFDARASIDWLPSYPDQVSGRSNAVLPAVTATTAAWAASPVFSPEGASIIAAVSLPRGQRRPCSYERSFLDAYRPNSTFYLPDADLRQLEQLGATPDASQPAGTWARHVFERLLIDLSWNSSRLEGNTYSLLDTERLFANRAFATGHRVLETQMLLNHKQAIEYLIDDAPTLRLEARTVRTLHGMLSENLLSNPADEGRLRTTTVGIHDSTFLPLDVPQQIEELFIQLLATAAAISNPFEQSFFLLVHIPYLQPFVDVNKRTSRLAANLPLVKANLQPLSFVDLPKEAYVQATLGLYELRRVEALRDVYNWAYRRSADRYRAIVKSMGEPDAFRLQYRDALRQLVRDAVQQLVSREDLEAHLEHGAEPFPEADRPRLRAAALQELKALNEGTFHRYGLRPAEFELWSLAHPRSAAAGDVEKLG